MSVQIKNGGLSAAAKRDLERIIAAAVAGERCPQASPHGSLQRDTVRELVQAGMIRSEVYRHNYRVITLLHGEHRGKTTAPAPAGQKPYMVNGRRVK